MDFFRKIYSSQFSYRLTAPFWLQRCWLSHLPKSMDWAALLTSLARFAHHHPIPAKTLRCGLRTLDGSQENWRSRLDLLLSDFHRWDQLRHEDERSLLGGLASDTPNTLAYAGMSPSLVEQAGIDFAQLELVETLLPRYLDEKKLNSQTIQMRSGWQVEDLVFQDEMGRFYDFRPEKQTLRAMRKGKKQSDSFHFGAFSLTLERSSIGTGATEMEHGAFQFRPLIGVDIDLVHEVVDLLQKLWKDLRKGQSAAAPYCMVEGDDPLLCRLVLTEILSREWTWSNRLVSPALVYGSHPLVSFAEFVCWDVGPRIFLSLKPAQGRFSYAMIYRESGAPNV